MNVSVELQCSRCHRPMTFECDEAAAEFALKLQRLSLPNNGRLIRKQRIKFGSLLKRSNRVNERSKNLARLQRR